MKRTIVMGVSISKLNKVHEKLVCSITLWHAETILEHSEVQM